MDTPNKEWVIVRIVTDGTGHPTVSVVGELFRGGNAEADCYRETARLNASSRQHLMEVYLARRVGESAEEEEDS
jgi:IS5 family transposase